MRKGFVRAGKIRIDNAAAEISADDVVVEEPMEIRVNGTPVAVTMRTPGDDFDLAFGFLRTEGLIENADDIGTIAYCPDEDHPELQNIVSVRLTEARRIEPGRVWATSACGVCGKTTLEAVTARCRPVRSTVRFDADVLTALPASLARHQPNFSKTGGLHAAGLFDSRGRVVCVREDIGRHNAVDKVLGAAIRQRLPVNDTILAVSGRLGFEIAQKAAMAGVPVVASVSAPSSLAIELAQRTGMTAIGFVRGTSLNVYSHSERILHGIREHSC